MNTPQFTPGNLIFARGREWIVLSAEDPNLLRVRPISGSEEDQTWIHLALEPEPVIPATFPKPLAEPPAGHDAALLLRDALLLSMRRGAGPFRSFGQIAVQPRAYQLVPLLMALKLDTVRLLIADDVGIGKTIEAGLIARELLERGEIERTTVLCPPHLVDQWVSELDTHFHLRAVPVTAAGAGRLERELPPSVSIFSAHPHTVVSLDYIKNERRREEFLRACPDFVIADEAHTCASSGPGRHQRYELLKHLAKAGQRHLIMLTATPHSGDEAAFYRLLGLLNPKFEALAMPESDERTRLREELSKHFVQRRRPDIREFQEHNNFPQRHGRELTYRLTGAWDQFFRAVLDYCANVVHSASPGELQQRLSFWTTLALMRCASSSPAAAAQALRTRAGLEHAEDDESIGDKVFDGASDTLPDDDMEPPAQTMDPALENLIQQAERLAGQSGDPKLKLLADHLAELFAEQFNPVVFCRYINTAHYLKEHLKLRFPHIAVEAITGELTAQERRQMAESMGDAEQRLLIATDCLSEGVNLQDHFDAVIHYDLSWNPTRHEQREGRVDRFGQTRPIVRTTLIYGENNPVDGAVLEVILKKAAKIREELGVPVPLPDDGHSLTQALMRAVFLRHQEAPKQLTFDFSATPEGRAIHNQWQNAADKAKKNRTVFAQRRLKPEDIQPEIQNTLSALGGNADVERFVLRALARLGAAPEAKRRGYSIPLQKLAPDVLERMEAHGLSGILLADFAYPPASRCRAVQRSHPLVSVLAETLLERSLITQPPAPGETNTHQDSAVLGRVGCWISAHVQQRTVIALLRLRHQLLSTRSGQPPRTLVVEEATALACSGASLIKTHEGPSAMELLLHPPSGDPPAHVRTRMIDQALSQLPGMETEFNAFARRRADVLLSDHKRARDASQAKGSYSVEPMLPPDVIALYILLPQIADENS